MFVVVFVTRLCGWRFHSRASRSFAGEDTMVPFIDKMTLPRGNSLVSLSVRSKVHRRMRLSESPALIQGSLVSKL